MPFLFLFSVTEMSFLFYISGQVLHEFLQVEAFAKLNNAIGKVGSIKGKVYYKLTPFFGCWIFLKHNGP